MTDLEKFQKACIDLDMDLDIDYYFHGISGEAGEVAELRKKFLRNAKKDAELRLNFKALLTEELGDLIWYIVVLAYKYDIPIKVILQTVIKKLNKRHRKGFYESNN